MTDHLVDQPDEAGAPAPVQRFGLHAEATSNGGAMVLTIDGELDMATAPILARDLNSALDARPSALTLDLSELTFVDSTGLSVLITAHRRAGQDGCAFVLRSPRRAVLRTLQLTGLDEHLTIEAPATDG
jgi:anti-sigma B factor antagonist